MNYFSMHTDDLVAELRRRRAFAMRLKPDEYSYLLGYADAFGETIELVELHLEARATAEKLPEHQVELSGETLDKALEEIGTGGYVIQVVPPELATCPKCALQYVASTSRSVVSVTYKKGGHWAEACPQCLADRRGEDMERVMAEYTGHSAVAEAPDKRPQFYCTTMSDPI